MLINGVIMLKKETLGIIGGGQMAEALLRGIINAELLRSDTIKVAEPILERREYLQKHYGISVTDSPKELAGSSSMVILAIKPQVMETVLNNYKKYLTTNHLLISIAAGIRIKMIEKSLQGKIRIIRVMPNTPALVLAGASALCGNELSSSEDMKKAVRLFSSLGICVELSEDLLDAVTGLSGSGPGYVFTFIEAMIDGGVLVGLPRAVARQLVLQTVYGSAKLALETGENVSVLKEKVTSPGGTTISGIYALEESGMRGAIMSAVEMATERSRELGQ